MKIKWIGKYDGKNLPTVDVEVGAKKLPEVTSKSAIMLIPIVLLFACCVYIIYQKNLSWRGRIFKS